MATIDLATRDGDGVNFVARSGAVRTPYLIWGPVIDLAAATTAKGSALAQADVIQALNVPAGSMVIAGGAVKLTAMTGTSTDLTFDIGVTGRDVDNLVDGWDFDAATVGSYATPIGVQEPELYTAADTIDILFTTQTNTVTGGTLRVFAVVVDVNPTKAPGLAALMS